MRPASQCCQRTPISVRRPYLNPVDRPSGQRAHCARSAVHADQRAPQHDSNGELPGEWRCEPGSGHIATSRHQATLRVRGRCQPRRDRRGSIQTTGPVQPHSRRTAADILETGRAYRLRTVRTKPACFICRDLLLARVRDAITVGADRSLHQLAGTHALRRTARDELDARRAFLTTLGVILVMHRRLRDLG